MATGKLQVLVVDDTVLYRRILSDLVDSAEGVELAGTAVRGDLAVQKMQRTPIDLVLLDLEMPLMDGLETMLEIRKMDPQPSVAMFSTSTARSAAARVEALRLGAIDFVEKPVGMDPEICRAMLGERLNSVIQTALVRRNLGASRPASSISLEAPPRAALLPVPAVSKLPVAEAAVVLAGTGAGKPSSSVPAVRVKRIDVVAIGISTGGPAALLRLIPSLPADLGVPVLIVQHMPPLFTASLAEDIGRKSKITVKEATEGEWVRAGVVFIAPGGRHMVVRSCRNPSTQAMDYVIGLHDGPPENSCRPAVDVLFRSIAEQYGGNMLAVVMTGMGSDGCEGVRDMRRKGCYCVTQAAASCVVYGMPLAVDEAGLSDESVPLDLLAARIVNLVKEGVKA